VVVEDEESPASALLSALCLAALACNCGCGEAAGGGRDSSMWRGSGSGTLAAGVLHRGQSSKAFE
jgi:hypothetical protein